MGNFCYLPLASHCRSPKSTRRGRWCGGDREHSAARLPFPCQLREGGRIMPEAKGRREGQPIKTRIRTRSDQDQDRDQEFLEEDNHEPEPAAETPPPPAYVEDENFTGGSDAETNS